MFDKLGQLAGLMRNLPNLGKLREESERFQQNLSRMVLDGDAGGGMVKVRVNGRMEILSCTLSDEALKLNDRELLEDLIKAAVNQAIDKARQLVAEETAKMAASMGLPMMGGLPGMGG